MFLGSWVFGFGVPSFQEFQNKGPAQDLEHVTRLISEHV